MWVFCCLLLLASKRLLNNALLYGMRGYFVVPDGKYEKLYTRAYIYTKESATTGLQTPITDKVTTKFIHNGCSISYEMAKFTP